MQTNKGLRRHQFYATKPFLSMKTFLLATLTLMSSYSVFAQSVTVSEFVEKHQPSASFYLYPSTLRMINRENNPDYQQLVRNIDKLSFLTFDKNSANLASNSVNQLLNSLREEAYQELMSFKDAGNQVYVYAKGDSPEAYVSMVDNEGTLMLFDVEGSPDLSALLRLVQSDFNFGPIAEMANLIGNKEKPSNPKNQ